MKSWVGSVLFGRAVVFYFYLKARLQFLPHSRKGYVPLFTALPCETKFVITASLAKILPVAKWPCRGKFSFCRAERPYCYETPTSLELDGTEVLGRYIFMDRVSWIAALVNCSAHSSSFSWPDSTVTN